MSIPAVTVTFVQNADGTVTPTWSSEAPFDEYNLTVDGTTTLVVGTAGTPLDGTVTHSVSVVPSAADAISASASYTPPTAPPSTPTNFVLSTVPTPAIVGNWDAEPSASMGFPITKDGAVFETVSTNSFTDSAVAAGETHSYTVAATNIIGTSTPTAPVSITVPIPSTRLIDYLVVIAFENQPLSDFNTTNAPFLHSLLPHGAVADNYINLAHPSLPNYVAAIAGTTAGVTSDGNGGVPSDGIVVNVKNLVDLLESAGLTWAGYMESMTTPLKDGNLYAQKHNPFIHFQDILSSPTRMAQIKPFSVFDPTKLENFVWISPNLLNDGHSPGGATGMHNFDNWCKTHVPPILTAMIGKRALLVLWADESAGGSNLLPQIYLGPAAKGGVVSKTLYSPGHYCNTHTWEHLFALSTLTANDAKAPLMSDMLA